MNNKMTLDNNLDLFEKAIGYQFKDKGKMLMALTHSSYVNENKNGNRNRNSEKNPESNERLEFLGDSVLNHLVAGYLYSEFPHLPEGEMTKIRALIVCETSLLKCSLNIGINNYLLLGKGEELTGGRKRPSILADAFEALLGAIFLDGGIENAGTFLLNQMKNIISDSVTGTGFTDYKTQLQELARKKTNNLICYEIISEKGPDHNKEFVSQIKLEGKILGTGKGKSKKEAEQNAAKAALEYFV